MKFSTFQRQSGLISNRLTTINNYIDSVEELQQLNDAQTQRLLASQKEAKSKTVEFSDLLDKFLESDPKDFDETLVATLQDSILDLHTTIDCRIKLLIPGIQEPLFKTNANVPTPPVPHAHAVRLPKLNLPTFNGNLQQWMVFSNLFETTIHSNTSLTPVEKFQYLLSSLQGEALKVIQSLPISNDNYSIAWNLIQKRYHQVRRLVSLHLDKILDLPNISHGSLDSLRHFLANYSENSQALIALDYDITKETLLIASLLRKLDHETRKRFEDSRGTNSSMPNALELILYLETECQHLENATAVSRFTTRNSQPSHNTHVTSKPQLYSSRPRYTQPTSRPTALLTGVGKTPNNCVFCHQSTHNIYQCTQFQNKTSQERFDFVRSSKFCFNCLGNAHTLRDCKSTRTCIHCNKRHHTLLHLTSSSNPQSSQGHDAHHATESLHRNHSGDTTPPIPFIGLTSQPKTTVLLATTLIQLTTPFGPPQIVRGVLDSAAQCSFITERCAQLLNVTRSHLSQDINGISLCHVNTKGMTNLNLSAINGTVLARSHPVTILDKITSDLPRTYIDPKIKQKLKSFVLADPTFDIPSPIDILIGADLFANALTGDRHTLGPNLPVAFGSIFGYVIMGTTPSLPLSLNNTRNDFGGLVTLLSTSDHGLHESLQRFWQAEEPPYEAGPTKEERVCEDHFLSTHSRDATGRYVVRLPFKESHSPLGTSDISAKHRFNSLERKLQAQPQLKSMYSEFMQDYLDSGHMTLCDTHPSPDVPHYFLPHHGVFKQNSSTTKLRVVFDASARTSTNVSLNDTLLPGPKLQNDICDVIFHFRRHSFVFSCDIRQMYRQIKVHSDDQKYQLIYWRDDPATPLSIYQLTTVTYGMSSSPFLALRTLRQLVQDEGHLFPRAASVLQNQTFVDDIIAGSNTVEDALSLQTELTTLLSKGGFELRKWSSNSPQLLNSVPEEHREKPLYFHTQEQPHISILGLQWTPGSDTFSYNINIVETVPTKRNVLSAVAQIYDPCGWLTPVVFWAKSLLQYLWTLGLQWDSPLPSEVATRWKIFLKELPSLQKVTVPRSLSLSQSTNIQLHGFSDASEQGYAAVVYLRCTSQDNEVKVTLILAKSRVAPLKRLSIPRLELCGAHLLAKLLQYCISLLSYHCHIDSTTAWCDSSIVLSWIQTPPYRLKVYVANRIAQIQEWTPPHIWSHISSAHNPADCASRGLSPPQLYDHPLWWHGPLWLRSSSQTWPTPQFTPVLDAHLLEVKPSPFNVLISTPSQEWELLSKFSSWTTLTHVIAYVLRFVNNSRGKPRLAGPLTPAEISESTLTICKQIQIGHFAEDISALQKDKNCSPRLQHLSPFLDEHGVVRVGGRLRHSNLPHDSKHPIVLPKSHHVVNLIIDHYHHETLHSGPQLLQATICKKFWIMSARSIIRSRIHKCIRCFKCKPRLIPPMMGDLPETRVTPARPFLKTGMDYGGPFLVKIHSLRRLQSVKAYLCLFVCFSTKAVHIEVVTDLSSDAFIAALTRFVSRRGLCTDLYSDCGTNFVGASSQLTRIVRSFLNQTKTQQNLNHFATKHSIRFHFQPPAAPHQGGLWERAIKSAKHHLIRVIGAHILTLEEFITLTTKVEAMLNSRPLIPISADPSEIDALTPGHFLIGSPLNSVPEVDFAEVTTNRLKRWQLVQAFSQRIWNRWQTEYLHTLQQRSKWTVKTNNLKIGDLVLVHGQKTSPLLWCIGRITATFPGYDGVVRVVTLKTSSGSLSRPAVKVFPLPLN